MDTPDTIWINTADTAERTGSDQSRSPVVVDREYRADRDTVRLRAGRVQNQGWIGSIGAKLSSRPPSETNVGRPGRSARVFDF